MSTLAQGIDNDILLTAGRASVITDKVAAAAILLANKFRFFLGEWFLDTRLGVPYREVVMVKNPDLRIVRQILRQVILTTPPIVDVISVSTAFDTAARKLSYTFSARCDNGQVITGGEGIPFIIEIP